MKKVNMIFREKKPLFWMALAFVMMISGMKQGYLKKTGILCLAIVFPAER